MRVIVIGPNRSEPGQRAGRLSSATLSFLERGLAGTEQDCWVVCHWPLLRTVMGDPRRHFTSAMEAFHAKPDAEIRALLARHRNARLWLSGHTHSPLSAPGLIKRTRLAPRRWIVAINASAWSGSASGATRAHRSARFTSRQQPACIEVRCRDHRAGAWRNVRGRRVVEIQT